jgi:predicted histidine transporter YuiF (NhaC family)
VEFFLEGFLFWMALSSSFSYFFHGVPNANSFALIYALLCSLLMGVVLVNIDKRIYNSFMEECLEGKVKKQNLEKCLLMLINTLIHNTKAEHKGVQFHVYSSIWRRLEEKGKVARPKKMKSGHQQDENMKEIY